MPRPRKGQGQVRISIGASILPDIDLALAEIVENQGRTKSQVIEKLLERGLAAYRRDGLLFEPKGKPVTKVTAVNAEDVPPDKTSTKRQIKK